MFTHLFNYQLTFLQTTKIHKVVKSIYKLKNSIPRDDEYKLRERCHALWVKWNAIVVAYDKAEAAKENGVEGSKEAKKPESAAPETNGQQGDDAEGRNEKVIKEVKVPAAEEKSEEITKSAKGSAAVEAK